ncbi:unnamed protein product [Ilex paraguariensis]|uniref:Uncharacterized protein n=1 Tax=Ilex paraguariensis TaxID=185542 RepID=A0ABC8UPK8_9AQUA
MESSPLARYTPQNSKKRVFPGGSSSCMEPEVVEISPPISRSSKSNKQKEHWLNQLSLSHYLSPGFHPSLKGAVEYSQAVDKKFLHCLDYDPQGYLILLHLD